MSIENAVRKRALLVESAGQTILNIKYPNEFELYVIALELVNQQNVTEKYFVFPIMPSTIDESLQQTHNIKRTLGGVVTLSSPNFVPVDISLTGNFGRKFKVLLGTDYKDFISSFVDNGKVTNNSFANGVYELFDNRVKTGYGCCKILEELVSQKNQISYSGGMKKLILHNLSFGNSYLVKPMSISFSQSQESNMIWNYRLDLKAIAPLDALYTDSELEEQRKRLGTTAFIQKGVDNVVNNITGLVGKANELF